MAAWGGYRGYDYEDDLAPYTQAPHYAGVEDELFRMDRLENPIAGHIQQVAVGGGVMVLVMEDPRTGGWEVGVYSLDDYKLRTPLARDKSESVHKVFIDPNGNHILISLTNGLTYYYSMNLKGVKKCDLKNRIINAVGWDKSAGQSVLLGDTQGVIIEARFEKNSGCLNPRQVYDLKSHSDSEDLTCISSLEVERFEGQPVRYLVLVTTPMKLYHFMGGPTLEGVFASYMHTSPFYKQMPGNQPTDLQLFRPALGKPARAYAWSTWGGIMHGKIDLKNPSEAPLTDEHVISFAKDEGRQNRFVGLVISEFHFYLLFTDRIQVLAQPPGLSWASMSEPIAQLKPEDFQQRTVWDDTFPAGKLNEARGIVKDPKTGQIYVYSQSSILELLSNDEHHNAWRSFLERAMDPKEWDREAYFDIAHKLCANDPDRQDKVNGCKADYFFEKGEYEQAAKWYSLTHRSFESTAIKFLKANKREALLSFLLLRLKVMKNRRKHMHQEATQYRCITTWIIQMYLQSMNQSLADPDTYADERDEFHGFIEANLELIDKAVTFELIASGAKPEELLFFVELLKDYRRVIAQYVNHREFDKAIEILTRNCLTKEYEELWYQFSPRLIQHAPHAVVSGWMMSGPMKFLKPTRLIPAIMKYNDKFNPPGNTQNQAIRYLKWLVNERKNRDPAIHNLLLSLYARQDRDTELLIFLEEHRYSYYYDLKYALRLCLEERKHRACVHVYSAMALYEDAVSFALMTDDLKLAKQVADLPEDDKPLRKKLWLCIVQHVVNTQGQSGVKTAISMLSECNALELEDILPFFPDFVMIQDFKKEICESLRRYNDRIDDLKTKMDEATEAAEIIRNDIKDLRHQYGYVSARQKCEFCGRPVLTANFCLFPACSHVFHQSCLVERQKKALQDDGSEDAARLLQKIQFLQEALTVKIDQIGSPSAERDLRRELNDIITAECALCGDIQIRECSLPFVTERDVLREGPSWQI